MALPDPNQTIPIEPEVPVFPVGDIDFPVFREPPPERPAPRSVLNKIGSSVSKRQLTVTPVNGPIRVIYGRDRIGADVTDPLVYNDKLVVMCVWGLGPCEAVERLTWGTSLLPGP